MEIYYFNSSVKIPKNGVNSNYTGLQGVEPGSFEKVCKQTFKHITNSRGSINSKKVMTL